MSDLENRKFLIIEYMIQTNLMSVYSLLLLFVPFTDESQLVGEGQTAEEAFNEHFKDHRAS